MAASALIDLGVVHRLVAAQLDTLASGTPALVVRHMGEEDPHAGDETRWVRHIDMVITSHQRVRGEDEPDLADIALVLLGVATEEETSRGAVSTVATLIRNAFHNVTLRDPATGTIIHQIDFTTCAVTFPDTGEAERRIRMCEVTVGGVVQRWSGTSVTSHLN